MRLIIPDSIKDYNIFKQVKVMFDDMNIGEFEVTKSKELPSLAEIIKLTNPSLSDDNIEFLYNVISSKKGLLQVINLMSEYLNFELNTYIYNDYNLELIDIKSLVTEDSQRFISLFNEVLDKLLFFGSLSITVRELTQLIKSVVIKPMTHLIITESNHFSLTPIV